MINKINICPIIKGHIETLKDPRGIKILKRDIVGFYLFPLAVSGYLTWGNFKVIDKYVNIGIIAHTIFIPLLVNVIFLIYNILEKNSVSEKSRKSIKILKQLYSNIVYTILISMLSLISLAIYSATSINELVKTINTFFLYFVLLHIFLTLLMIFKRIHLLLSKEIKDHAEQGA